MLEPATLRRGLRRAPGMVVGVTSSTTRACRGFGTLAAEGDPSHLTWEIGSITKALTGILLAEMAGRGEVALDDPIARHLPEAVAERLPDRQPTLRHLATHTSGLPRLPRSWLWRLRGRDDPYADLTDDDVWDVLGPRTRLPGRPRFAYSNFGMGLLGHVLARAGGAAYKTLLTERVLAPLGMTGTTVGGGTPVPGFRRRRPTPPWTFGALAAAGAVRSSAADLLALGGHLVDPPPGPIGDAITTATAIHHRGRVVRVGLGWMYRLRPPGRDDRVVWHDGGTYGTASFLAVDLDRGTVAVAFANRGPSVLGSAADTVGWSAFDAAHA